MSFGSRKISMFLHVTVEVNELGHSISYNTARESSEDSGKPVYTWRLTRVFAVMFEEDLVSWLPTVTCEDSHLSLRWAHVQFVGNAVPRFI